LATELLAGGASLPQIADVLGHSCLATTRIYAAVDIGRLRKVGLPWPQTGTES
jgi:site-specific recombinase XerD